MKDTVVDFRQYFQPVLRTRPWKVKLGVGSFLTFEFGPRVRAHGHVHGQWHLWIYLSNWKLFRGNRQLVDSDADRKLITVSTRRLEEKALTNVDFNARTQETTFFFDDFRLVVSPADYLESPDDRDNYWMFFMPENEVLVAGPAGIRVERGDTAQSSEDGKKQEVRVQEINPTRAITLSDKDV
jgi:hypothetical protein